MHRFWRMRLSGRVATLFLAVLLAFSLAACGSADNGNGTSGKATDEPTETVEVSNVVLASTTSTQDSGLFDELIPAFEKANPEYKIKVIAVGTGEALKLGETRDADVLLVHAKSDEEKFVANGFGVARNDVMYNDFIIVGPKEDPAKVKGSADTTAALKAIADSGATFISRGDDSGTHKKELKLWKTASISPTATGDWYQQSGQGMGETLTIAQNKPGYTLADRATFLSMKDTLDLEIVLEGDPGLLNQYGVIVVADAKNQEGGQVFADWILSKEGQKVIGEFGVEEFGEALFTPNASE